MKLEELIEENRDHFISLAKFKFTKGDEFLAEDLFQDVALKVLTNKDKFDGTNFKGWFFVIMRNTYLNSYRIEKVKNKLDIWIT